MKILGIVASPRKLGNSEILIKEICRSVKIPHSLEILRLTDCSLEYCRACYKCFSDGEKCPINDDLYWILERIKDSDAIIIASPVYFLGPHSSLKKMIDRGLSFYAYLDYFWRKPSVGIAVAGIEGKEGYSLLGIENFLKMIFSDIKSCKAFYGALPGEVLMNEENRIKASVLGEELLNAKPQVDEIIPSCSICKGKTFRFINKREFQCMLCSNYGMIDFNENSLFISMKKSSHEFFMTRKDILDHKNWLIEMKERFLVNKRSLKKIALDYRKDGVYIQPSTL